MEEQVFEMKYGCDGKQQENSRENGNVIGSVIDQEKSHLKIKWFCCPIKFILKVKH